MQYVCNKKFRWRGYNGGMRIGLLLPALATLSGSLLAAPNLQNVLIPDASLPSDCRRSANLYPLNDRVTKIWNYRTYAMVLPPYKRKEARSFDCGGQKGTLYYFEYATAEQREKAVLFARPVLTKGADAPQVEEWEKGFLIVSFAEPPAGLMTETRSRLTGKPRPAPATVVSSTPPAASVPPPAPKAEPTRKPAPAAAPTPVPSSPAAPYPTPDAPISDLSQMVSPGPSMRSDPFGASESPSLTARKPAPPPPPPAPRIRNVPRASVVPPAAPKPAPVVAPPPPPPPPVPVAVAKPAIPPAKPLPAPAAGAADLSSSVIESYAFKIGCHNEQRTTEVVAVCGLMQDFASGLPVELPLEDGVSRMGPVYTIDSYGRFTALQQNVLGGTSNPLVVSFFALESKGGRDDFEIKSLVEARKQKTALPANDMRERIRELTARKRFGWSRTNARSMTFQPETDRRLYVRRAGDRLIFIGTSGNTLDEQTRSSLVVSVLY